MVDVGILLAKQMDNFVHASKLPMNPHFFEKSISGSSTHKARLLHYFPACDKNDENMMDSWCGVHVDHSIVIQSTFLPGFNGYMRL